MSDVANILGVNAPVAMTAADEAARILAAKTKIGTKIKQPKPKGMSREVYSLMGVDSLVPTIQTNKAALGFKNKRMSATHGRWIWAPFSNSARRFVDFDYNQEN